MNNRVNIWANLDLGKNQLENFAPHIATGIAGPVNGQMYLSSTDNCLYYYLSASGRFIPLTSVFGALLGGASPTGHAYFINTNSRLDTTGNGVIDANQFNGNTLVAVEHGGTNNSNFTPSGIIFYDGNSVRSTINFYYDISTDRIVLGDSLDGVANIHLGYASGPTLYVYPNNLVASPVKNVIEYNGTGWYYTDNFGLRYEFATTGTSLSSFVGTLPISKGGTNATSLASGSLLQSNGTSVVGLTAAATNEIPIWNGFAWTASSGGFISQVPNSVSRNTIVCPSSTFYPLLIQGASGQTTYLKIETSAGQNMLRVLNTQVELGPDLLTFDRASNSASSAYIWLEADGGVTHPYIQMRPQGGNGGYIKMDGGGNTSKAAGHIDLSGGAGTASPGGNLELKGGGGAGANGGFVLSNGGGTSSASGGVCNLSGGSVAGGHLLTVDGGGTLNTNSGFIQLGTNGRRSTILTQPTGNSLFNLPTAGTGWLLAAPTIYTSGYAYFSGTGYLIATGIPAPTNNQAIRSVTAYFTGSPISSGQLSFTRIPYAGIIQKYTVLARPTGSLIFDIRPTGYSAYPTNNSICGSTFPSIVDSIKNESSTLTGWNTSLASGTCIDFVVTSGNGLITQATLILDILAE